MRLAAIAAENVYLEGAFDFYGCFLQFLSLVLARQVCRNRRLGRPCVEAGRGNMPGGVFGSGYVVPGVRVCMVASVARLVSGGMTAHFAFVNLYLTRGRAGDPRCLNVRTFEKYGPTVPARCRVNTRTAIPTVAL
jgi:hypothetical protein